jgi:hypothetical protein
MMKNLRIVVIALAAVALAALSARAGSATHPGWERLKSLVGDWEGKHGDTAPFTTSYKLVSNGTALMETMTAPGETEMVTVYHPDGERLMATHYCAGNNQPRMRTGAPAGDAQQLTFSFLDVTNLASPDADHMKKLVVTFQDPDHFKQEWTSWSKGKEDTVVFNFTRKK